MIRSIISLCPAFFVYLLLERSLAWKEEEGDRGSSCNLTCSTTQTSYVCGSDGRTYLSECALSRANCEKPVQAKHPGECTGVSRCVAERKSAQEIARKPTSGIFIPECNPDGSYVDAQCHSGIGFCWCVTKLGRPLPGSSARLKKPDCTPYQSSSNIPTRRIPRGRKPRKSCSTTDREEFNKNMMQIFAYEYKRIVNPKDDSAMPTSAQIVNWKFSQLDLSIDLQLQKSEVQDLRRMIKRRVDPKPCARTFSKFCDMNQDGNISQTEWSVCLAVNGGSDFSKITEHSQELTPASSSSKPEEFNHTFSASKGDSWQSLLQRSRSRPSSSRTRKFHPSAESMLRAAGSENRFPLLLRPEPSETDVAPFTIGLREASNHSDSSKRNRTRGRKKPSKPPSCEEERLKALAKKRKDPSVIIYIPSCDSPAGNYAKVQCHTEFCWCVNPANGQPIPETSAHNAQPDCSQPVIKIFQGCPSQRKEKFLTDLVAELRKEMEQATQNNRTNELTTRAQLMNADVVSWKFEDLNINHDEFVEKSEWKPFKLFMASHGNLARCGRAYFKYCDADDDHKVTTTEFLTCTTITKDGVALKRRPHGRRPPRPPGPNPLEAYLKAD